MRAQIDLLDQTRRIRPEVHHLEEILQHHFLLSAIVAIRRADAK